MEFEDVVRRRRMVRRFDRRPLDPAVVERILRNAARGPSAGFSQGYAFLVFDGADEVASFWTALRGGDREPPFDPAVTEAPLIVVPLANRDAYLDRYAEPDKGWTDRDEAHWPVPYWHIDTGFAALLMLLTAVDEGLGALFFGLPPDVTDRFRTAFEVPGSFVPIGALAIGHRTGDPGRGSGDTRRRIPVRELVHRARW
jgi:nitroreductase